MPLAPVDKLTAEQRNRVLRAHHKPLTLSAEEIVGEVKSLAADQGHVTNLELLFNSVKTLKLTEQLAKLLQNPRPDVNEGARRIAKLPCFRAHQKELGLTPKDPFELSEFEANPMVAQKLFAYCAEHKRFADFYKVAHKLNFEGFQLARAQLPNKKYMEEVYPEVTKDFEAYRKNAEAVANTDAAVDTGVVARLRFALSHLDAEKMDAIAKKHLLEHHLLTTRFQGTVKEVVAAFKLHKNNRVSADNYLSSLGEITSMKLYKKNLIQNFSIIDQHVELGDVELQRRLRTVLQTLSLVTFFPFEQLAKELVTDQMAVYHAYRTFEAYKDRISFIEGWRKAQQPLYKTEPIMNINEIDIETIKTMRAYLAQVKKYVASQVNPSLAVMQTEAPEDFFATFPVTEEAVECVFEKVLLNKKDRHFNGDKRIAAMKALLIGPFVHGHPKALLRGMRYVAAAAQTTTNSGEKAQILNILEPCQLMTNTLFALNEGIFKVDFVDFSKEFAEVYFRYPDALTRYSAAFSSQLPQTMFTYAFNSCAGIASFAQQIVDGLMKIQTIIPNIKYSVNSVVVQMPVELQRQLTFDLQSIYETEKDVTNIVPLTHLYKKAKNQAEFKELVLKQFEKVFQSNFAFFQLVQRELAKTQPKFLEHQKKVAEAVAKKVVLPQFEDTYCQLYQKMMAKTFFGQLPDQNFTKLAYKTKTPEEQELQKEFNDAILELPEDIRAHKAVTGLVQFQINEVLVHQSSIGFKRFVVNVSRSNNAETALRFYAVALEIAKYTRAEYQAKYDEKRLASEFLVNNPLSFHQDILSLMAFTIKQIARQVKRSEKAKQVVTAFCLIVTELQACNMHLQESYNNFYTAKFARVVEGGRGKKAKAKNFGDLKTEMDAVLFGFNILIKNVAPSQMIDIAGDLMCAELFAPMGVHVVTHLQHVIKYDQSANLDDLFSKKMPMSSLKTLIKFLFKSHEVDLKKIQQLFYKSSIDGRVCILEHFYYRAATEHSVRPLFLELLALICTKNPDVFLLFFGNVYQIPENLEFNRIVLDTVRAIIECEKMSPYMLNFSAFLAKVYAVPFERAIAAFQQLALQDKEADYILVYLLKNFPQNQPQLHAVVCQKLLEAKHEELHRTVCFRSFNNAVSAHEGFDVDSQAFDLLNAVLKAWATRNQVHQMNMQPNIAKASPEQLKHFIQRSLALNYNVACDEKTWKNLAELKGLDTFTTAFVQIQMRTGVKKDIVAKLSEMEELILQKVARAAGYKYYQE